MLSNTILNLDIVTKTFKSATYAVKHNVVCQCPERVIIVIRLSIQCVFKYVWLFV